MYFLCHKRNCAFRYWDFNRRAVNNWNEDRKKLKHKASYGISLMNDLSLDTLMLGRLIDEDRRILEFLEMQQQRILRFEIPIVALWQF